jgi:anti-anti-sigma factor
MLTITPQASEAIRGVLAGEDVPDDSVFRIASEPEAGLVVADGANAKALEDEFIRVEATSVSRVVLDLSELEFIDATGLAVILRADKRAKNDGHVLRLLRPQGRVRRAFELCGLDELLAFGN